MKHTVFDNELDAIRVASDALFCPQDDNPMDARTAYQEIHHTIKMLKERQW
jgi:hypothetical protein